MEELNLQIEDAVARFAAERGRLDVITGFADIADIPRTSSELLPYTNAVAIAVAVDPKIISQLDRDPTIEYYDENEEICDFLDALDSVLVSEFASSGYHAMTLDDARDYLRDKGVTSDDTPALRHRIIAAHAGLGWIGKSGLVITKHYGPAVRLSTVLTDAPLDCCREVFLSRCSRCMECIVACPAGAINNTEWTVDLSSNDLIDETVCQDECFRLTRNSFGIEANLCGLCVYACPYTKSFLRRNGLPYS